MFAAAKVILGLMASATLGWFAIRGLDWSLVAQTVAGVSPGLLALSVSVFLLAGWLRAARWQVLFTTERISTRRLFIIQHEGLGLSNLMPIRVASEVTQLAVLTLRDGVRGATALATLAMERVIDVVATTMILGASFYFVPEMEDFSIFIWGAAGFAVVALVLVRVFAWSGSLALVSRFRFVLAFATAVRELEQERMRLAVSLLISIGYWMMVGVTAWLSAAAVGLDISPLAAMVAIMGTIFFATAVPAAPSAVGTYEFALVHVLTYFGVDRAEGFGFAVITHAIFFLPATIIAIVFLPREGIGFLRRKRDVQAHPEVVLETSSAAEREIVG